MLEQANNAAAAANKVPEPEHENGAQDSMTKLVSENAITKSSLDLAKPEAEFVSNDNGRNLDVEIQNSETSKVDEVVPLTDNQAVAKDCVKVESLTQETVADKKEDVIETELSGTKLMEKPLLKVLATCP